mmetsp:Transcript_18311/g.27333  ORF Transcript_18311/g.27333 Transcript_18311/m.27333 type:complete len:117 (+) Transcript_18311:174-524(+)
MSDWEKGPCQCFSQDCGLCCYSCWCPCFALKEVADNLGKDDSTGLLYFVGVWCGFGLCVQTAAALDTAEKAGIDHGFCSAFTCTCCWGPCHLCTILNESRNIKEGKAPEANKIERE